MKYTAKYFSENMPDWKKNKDPFLSRIFYRRVSFYCSAIAANNNISANTVSYFSGLLAVFACICYLFPSYAMNIVGAVLINVWLVLDCTDGNLARCVKKQPFGEFADGISSYILVGLMCSMMGMSVYFHGGILFPKSCPWIILIGALASTSDTLMRLVYQKYKSTALELVKENIIKPETDKRIDHNEVRSLRVRIEAELGIGGILPLFILVATIFGTLDLVLLYCFFYYTGACTVVVATYVRKAIKHVRELEIGDCSI